MIEILCEQKTYVNITAKEQSTKQDRNMYRDVYMRQCSRIIKYQYQYN